MSTPNTEEIKTVVEAPSTVTPPAASQPIIEKASQEMDDAMAKILMGLDYTDAPKPKEEEQKTEVPPQDTPKDEAKAEVKTEAKQAEATAEPPEKAAEPVKEPVEEKEPIEKIARTIAKEFAETLKFPPAEEPAKEAPAAKPGDELNDDEKRDYAIFQEMERMDPRYKGISERFRQGIARLNNYIAKWERENPGEVFDPEAEENAKIVSHYLPDHKTEDFDDARVQLRARLIVQEERRKEREEQAKKDKEQASIRAEEEVQKRIYQKTGRSFETFVEKIDPEILKQIKTPEGQQKFDTEEKVVARELKRNAISMRQWIGEVEKLSDPRLQYRSTPGNPIHEGLETLVGEMQAELASRPKVKDGKMFATLGEYGKMTPEQRRLYWTITVDDIQERVVDKFAQEAKETISEIRSYAKRFASSGTPNKAEKVPNASGQVAAPQKEKPVIPSSASGTDAGNVATGKIKVQSNSVDVIEKSLWG